ncbi:hypothetical protein TSUD_314690 [Trifolium subterraneum]|uniref:Uncharacterized protein n=1 Tax=Trifolium subterraneum TaxID=3900 RepID=A0A2Z6MN67_TRISU|nr:hypothetical protein TSUD_314690 [Trifolium subterraneum]
MMPSNDNDTVLPYWLSNTSALVCLLQKNVRSNGFLTTTAQRYAGSSGLTTRMGHCGSCRLGPSICIIVPAKLRVVTS